MKISVKAIDKPVIVTLITILIVLLGLISLFILPLEENPEINVPYVVAVVPYPGAAAEDVEEQVTVKVDERLNGIKNMKNLFSSAREQMSVHVIEFFEDADKQDSLTDVKDKIDLVKRDLPEDVEEPIVEDISFDSVPIIVINVSGDADPFTLKEIAKDIKTEIEAVPGVKEVAYYGGFDREVQVQIDPKIIEQYSLSYSMIIDALKAQNVNLPGGHLKLDSYEYLVRTEGKFKDVNDIGTTVVAVSNEHPVYLKDIAKIINTHKKIESYSRNNGKQNVSLVVYKQDEINTLSTISKIKKLVSYYDNRMPKSISISTSMDKSEDISLMVSQLGSNALYGGLLVLTTLMLFMGLRNALIIAIAIPFSLFAGFLLMWVFGFTLNMITIFSMILILGLVVDGALIVGENIYHYFEKGYNPIKAAKDGIYEIGTGVISADFTTIAAFFPMIFIAGIMGQFMSYMPWVVIFALSGSIIIDHFTLPVIATKHMKQRKPREAMKPISQILFIGNRLFRYLIKYYKPILRWSLYHRKTVILIAITAFFVALSIIGFGIIPVDFFPKEDLGRFNINFNLPIGSSVKETNKIAIKIENILSAVPEVKEYISTIGNTGVIMSDLSESAGSSRSGPEFGKILVNVGRDNERKRTQSEIMEEIDNKLKTIPGINYSFFESEMGPPVGDPVAVRIYGDELPELKRISKQVEAYLNDIPGTYNIENSFRENKPQIRILINRSDAARYGISARQITVDVMAAFLGYEATEIMIGDELVDIRVINKDAERENIENVLDMPIITQNGLKIPLKQIADIKLDKGMDRIYRRNLKRSIVVTSKIKDGSTPMEVLSSVEEKILKNPPPQGYLIEYGGEEEERQKSFESITRVMFLGILLIFFVLTAQFDSFKQPLIVMLSIPLSIVGVVIGLSVTGLTFSFMAFIGVVALIGIVVNDAIVLVDFINKYRRKGMDIISAIEEAGPRRLRPVMLTTITTIGGLLPLTLNWGGGGTFWAPLGTSIIFGLLFATLLTLIVVPTVYTFIERKFYKKAISKDQNAKI